LFLRLVKHVAAADLLGLLERAGVCIFFGGGRLGHFLSALFDRTLLQVALLALLVMGADALTDEALPAADALVDRLLDSKWVGGYMWENYCWRMGLN